MNQFLSRVEELRKLHARGLSPQTVISTTKPVVTPKDFYVSLPDNYIDAGDMHGYGKLEDFISYLRMVNSIPMEAEAQLSVDQISRDAKVRFVWYEVELVTDRKWRKNYEL